MTRKGEDGILPDLQNGVAMELVNLDPKQLFTRPPARFSEAALVKSWRNRGLVGRRPTHRLFQRFRIVATFQSKVADFMLKNW